MNVFKIGDWVMYDAGDIGLFAARRDLTLNKIYTVIDIKTDIVLEGVEYSADYIS